MQVIDVIAPSIVKLFNRLLAASHFPAGFKEACVTPIVKKPGLNATDVRSYRPISNLLVLSKLLKHLVARQLMDYLMSADLLPPRHGRICPTPEDAAGYIFLLCYA